MIIYQLLSFFLSFFLALQRQVVPKENIKAMKREIAYLVSFTHSTLEYQYWMSDSYCYCCCRNNWETTPTLSGMCHQQGFPRLKPSMAMQSSSSRQSSVLVGQTACMHALVVETDSCLVCQVLHSNTRYPCDKD